MSQTSPLLFLRPPLLRALPRPRAAPVCAASAPVPQRRRRARCPPKRPVQRYELKLARLPPHLISFTNDAPQQAAFATFVALMAASVLLPPLFSPPPALQTAVAAAAAAALGLWAVDALALDAALQRAAWQLLQSRRRVARHEAAHILVAHLLGLRVQSFTEPTAARQLRRQRPGAVVSFDGADAYDICAVAAAGAVAELRAFGDARGGVDDFELAFRAARSWPVVYWGVLAADLVLAEHPRTLLALEDAILRRHHSLPDLLSLVDSHHRSDHPDGADGAHGAHGAHGAGGNSGNGLST